ncbi:MAG: murein L,D-transpeptidase YafK [Neolewinella sp.]|jgi:murein L,D-transpeptidase YafK
MSVKESLADKGLNDKPFDLFLRVFKHEDVIEVWVKPQTASKYVHLQDFPVCQKSGDLGPKRQQGDLQVPEGVYFVDRFNPNSSYHLSLGLNYPNKSDRIRGHQTRPGGDIFIHGECVTVGCLPITNPLIEELYALAEIAKGHGNPIAVHIFPFRMKDEAPTGKYWEETTVDFWKELQPVYNYFEEKQELPTVGFDAKGAYIVK